MDVRWQPALALMSIETRDPKILAAVRPANDRPPFKAIWLLDGRGTITGNRWNQTRLLWSTCGPILREAHRRPLRGQHQAGDETPRLLDLRPVGINALCCWPHDRKTVARCGTGRKTQKRGSPIRLICLHTALMAVNLALALVPPARMRTHTAPATVSVFARYVPLSPVGSRYRRHAGQQRA